MGCNVSKDGKEKSKKSASNSSQRSSTKENGDGKGTVEEKCSLVSDVINAQEQNESATEVDIDCDDPEVQQAATKIQAAFRGSQARKTISEKMQQQPDKSDAPPLEEEIDVNDPEINQAAAKIQASFRGHMVRKDMKKQDNEKSSVPADTSQQRCEDDEIDIDLNDPNVEKAATKIQASFRGHLVRKQRNTPNDDTA